MSCRRATSDTTAPAANDSATIRPLVATLQRRRRPTPTRISTRPRGSEASSIWSTIGREERDAHEYPIAMVACDAVESGFVTSLAHPGGNLTGVTCLISELMPKRMGVFRELLPSASRVGPFQPGER